MKIIRIWFTDERLYGETDDGRILWQSLLYYHRLKRATTNQREQYHIGEEGIHWPELDEDVSFESFEYSQPEPKGISRFFLEHPEINATAIARKLGISQSLFAQYINGTKRPSEERKNDILIAIHDLGEKLTKATF